MLPQKANFPVRKHFLSDFDYELTPESLKYKNCNINSHYIFFINNMP